MAGVGLEWDHVRQGGVTTNSVAGEAVLDFIFWPCSSRRNGGTNKIRMVAGLRDQKFCCFNNFRTSRNHPNRQKISRTRFTIKDWSEGAKFKTVRTPTCRVGRARVRVRRSRQIFTPKKLPGTETFCPKPTTLLGALCQAAEKQAHLYFAKSRIRNEIGGPTLTISEHPAIGHHLLNSTRGMAFPSAMQPALLGCKWSPLS
jgi:hypothetical protein